MAISKFALLASSHNEIRNAEAVKLRLSFIENEENLCQQRLDLLSNVFINFIILNNEFLSLFSFLAR